MRLFILVLSLIFCSELIAATNIMDQRLGSKLQGFEIFSNSISQLKKKIAILKKRIQETNHNKIVHENKNDDEEMKQKIFEKHLLPRANGTSVLKDFYPGRYSV
jgi:hypothetical protein